MGIDKIIKQNERIKSNLWKKVFVCVYVKNKF